MNANACTEKASVSPSIEITGKRESGHSNAICLASVSAASAGTPTADGGKSLAGHLWYSVSCPSEIGNGWGAGPYSFGFSQKGDKPIGPGGVNVDGDDHHDYKSYVTHTFSVTVAAAEAMRGFGQDPFAKGTFSSFYNVLTNSCVDFVWKALEIGGFQLAPYDPSKVNPKTLLPRQEEPKGQTNNSRIQNMVLLFTGDSLGQIHPNPVSLPVFPEMPGFDKRIMRHPLIAASSMLAFVDGQFTCSWLALL